MAFVQSVLIIIDGKKFKFESLRDRREIEPQAYVSEKNWYKPNDEFLKALKNAKSVKYRLTGRDYYIDFKIKPKKLLIIPDFF